MPRKKITPLTTYLPSKTDYHLLPFRFERITDKKEVLVNEVGDCLIVNEGIANKIANREISISDELYPELISKFFISEEPIPPLIDVYATRYRTAKAFLESFTALHIFVVTLRCNNACNYCQVSRKNEDNPFYDMSIPDLDKSIELMFNSPSKNLTVEFQGGEPLLVFDEIKYAIEEIVRINERLQREITFVICTNLTLIDSAILDFCRTHNVLISTSLDGPKFLHNSNRPSTTEDSCELFTEKLRLCREELEPNMVSALMTTSELSMEYPREIVDEYLRLGFTSIFFRAINPYGYSKGFRCKEAYHIGRFLEFYKFALNYIIELNLKGIFFVEEFAGIILTKIFTPFSVGFTDLQSPSGVINSVLVYNYDGYVYPSDESRMLAEEGDRTFRLGHVQRNSYSEIVHGEMAQKLSNCWANETLPGCSECAFQAYCGADPIRNHATQGDMVGFRPTNIFCIKNKEIIRYLFELFSSNSDIEKIFLSWVNRTPLDSYI